jgi:hypothetical protein
MVSQIRGFESATAWLLGTVWYNMIWIRALIVSYLIFKSFNCIVSDLKKINTV